MLLMIYNNVYDNNHHPQSMLRMHTCAHVRSIDMADLQVDGMSDSTGTWHGIYQPPVGIFIARRLQN